MERGVILGKRLMLGTPMIDVQAQPRRKVEADVCFFLSSFVTTLAHRAKCAWCPNLVHVLGIGAFIICCAIATGLPTVQSSKAQTPTLGMKSSITLSGNPRNGKLVFKSQGCGTCHGSQGEGFSAPNSSGRMPRIALTTLALPTFVRLIRKPEGQMPSFGTHQVSDSELIDVYAFLESLAPPVEHGVSIATNIETGQRLYTKYGCSECHLNQGEGARQSGASRLGPPQIPLSAFIDYVREPTGEMPPYTQKTVSNEELADMYAFMQSVRQPPSWKTIPLLDK
jgi:mono/diheme cytochrome c family protein